MPYFKKMVGDRIYLSPMNVEDAEVYCAWLGDVEVSRFLGNYRQVISLAGERKAIERMADEGYNFAIVGSEDDKLMGNISLMDVDNIERTATLGIFIGDAKNRGRGIGAEAIRLILAFGFEWLNLQNIMLTVHAENARGIACYKKVGFKEFGRRRMACFGDGHFSDQIYMEILKDEFSK